MTSIEFMADLSTNADVERGGNFLHEHKDEYPELRDAIINNLHATPSQIIDLIATQYPLARFWKYNEYAKKYIANLQLFFLEKGTK